MTTIELNDNITTMPDDDGGVSVGVWSFGPDYDYDSEIEESVSYLSALVAGKRHMEFAGRVFTELRVQEAAKVLYEASQSPDCSSPPPLLGKTPELFMRQARAILAAIEEGRV